VAETEARLLALELILAEAVAWLPEGAFDQMALAISASAGTDADGRRKMARHYAVELLRNGRWRCSPAT